MESSSWFTKACAVENAKIFGLCLSNDDALEALANDDSEQYKLQKLSECTGAQIESSPGVSSFRCAMCQARLKKMALLCWRCNEMVVDEFIEEQNKAKKVSEISQNHLHHSAEQTVGTEPTIIKTEVTSPDEAKDLHSNQKCCIVHEANRTYECCGTIPDDLFEAQDNPIAIKSEQEEVDEQHQLQTTNDVLDHDPKRNPVESICQDQKHHPVTVANNTYPDDLVAEAIQNVLTSGTQNVRSKSSSKHHKHHCPHCSATYPALYMLKIHIRTHTGDKPFKCNVCDKAFPSSSNMAKHSKIHNDDQKHRCPHCSSRFAQLSNLKIHIRTHTGEKPNQCEVCDKAFPSSSNLTKHSKIHSKDQQLQCPHCSLKFPWLSHLKDHIRTHTGERPYKCNVCDKAFRTQDSLAKHSKTHTFHQQHQCPYCSSMFAYFYKLKIHIRTHTGEKPYQCEVCGKAFHSSGDLAKHSKIHNKGKKGKNKVE